VKTLSWTGEDASEEHSDPERRSPAVSRLLSMTSRAADFLRGWGLEMVVGILMAWLWWLFLESLNVYSL
jgi:hypothetical protein